MARQWTPEERARQAEAIRTWQPWKHSTGPRTPAGKEASSANRAGHFVRIDAEIEQARQEILRIQARIVQLKRARRHRVGASRP